MTFRQIRPGSLVWVPDDSERGIVLAWNSSRTKLLVCFAAWKNGAEATILSDAQEPLFESRSGALAHGWEPPHAIPRGTFLAWYPVEHVEFAPPAWEDRPRYCREAYPEDDLLGALRGPSSTSGVTLEALAKKYGWDEEAVTDDGERGPSAVERLAEYVALLEADLDGIDSALGLGGEHRTRFYGDRVVRAETLLRELTAYRNASKAAKFVR